MPAFLLSCILSVKGRSVSSCRNTRYAEGASSVFHSSSVLVTFTMVPISIFGGIVLLLSCGVLSEMSRGAEVILTHGLVGEQGTSRMLKQSASRVLASLRGSTYRSVRLASSLAAALPDELFEHPARACFCVVPQ